MGQFGMGQAVRRVEDKRFVTGAGNYTDDVNLPRQGYAAILRSPHAHARIASIDVSEAGAAPGVLGVFIHADMAADGWGSIQCAAPVPNKDGSPPKMPPHYPLAKDRVRHVGDAVAFVVAETLGQAKDALDLIRVEYDALPAATDLATCMEPGQPLVWDEAPRNLCLDWETGDAKATEAAFAKAKHVVELELVNNRIVVNSMEPRGALGLYEPGEERWSLWSSTQGSHFLRKLLSAQMEAPENRIRVVTPDVGGGFGMKLFLYPEHGMVLFAAKRLGRPVKWTGERSDAFVTDTHGRDNLTKARLALDEQGRFLALRVDTIANLGAYLSNYGPFIPTLAGTAMLAAVYKTPAIYCAVKSVFTHTVPVDAYRGAGRPESAYIVERIVDHAARKLGIPAAELRRRNFIRPEDMPFRTVLGRTYDSGDFARNMDDALKAADAAGFPARKAASRARGQERGLGFATYIEECGGGSDEVAELRFDPSGSATLLVGTQSSGQGHQTAYAQLLADKLGVDMSAIRVVQGDTETMSFGRGTGGSRSLPVAGVAVERVADKLIDKGRRIAAHRLEAAEADIEFADGQFRIAGTDRSVPIQKIAKAAFDPLQLPPGLEPGFAEKLHFLPADSTYPNGCHVCEVEIDPETGRVEVVRYLVVDDFGRIVNPLLLAGQVHGGVGQGIGQAVLEGCVYDPETGQLLTASLNDYALPRADDVPPVEFSTNVVPCTTNPLGIKGAGEAGAIGAPPAVINAIVDALAEFGVEHIDMPATPERVWRAVHGGQLRAAAE
jgi:carbon-monoxide dehydrogenase large subunit